MKRVTISKQDDKKAWQAIHLSRRSADAMGEAAARKVAEGWGELDKPGDEAAAKIAAGMDELAAASEIEEQIEATALALAKRDLHVKRMHQYMAKPETVRRGPFV